MDCLFCSFGKGEKKALAIYEDNATYAFLDIHPKGPGHTMVIPKLHRENILDLSASELTAVFRTVQTIVRLLKDKLGAEGFTIGINHGRISGQVVEHLHVHIIPRFSDDRGGSIHSVVDNPPAESLEEIQKKII
jgi:histidine triad (HIT) family protein